jgi:uncharacterized protein
LAFKQKRFAGLATSKRALMPDYLRFVALFGIVVVNVQFMAFSALQNLSEPIGGTNADMVTAWLVLGLALLKTYGLFSFMFGVGLGFMIRSATERGLPFGRIYRNRMVGLLALGIIHGCLFFPGDILTIYAITGSILYLFRNWSARRLVRVGAGLLAVQLVVGTPLLVMPAAIPQEIVEWERAAMGSGSFLEAIAWRTVSYAFTVPLFLLIQGTSALGWFCLGFAAVKSGLIDQPDHLLWRRSRQWCLPIGLALSLAGAAMWQWGPSMVGAVLTLVVAPISTLGYLGVIAAISGSAGPRMRNVLDAGSSSLSIYLGQSIVLSTLFSAYGLGLWEEVSRLAAVAIAIGVTILLVMALSWWRARVGMGPFEWLLRTITYGNLRRQ